MLGYGLAGVLGGILVGLLRPLATGRIGGMLIGMLTGAFAYSAIMIVVDGIDGFRRAPAILAGTLVGGVLGFHLSGPAGKAGF